MAKRKAKAETVTLRHFVQAAVFNQPLARQMLQADRSWLAARSGSGETALADVVVENYVDAARFLIGQGADVNTRDNSGETPLMYAAILGYAEMVALLLQRGADVNAVDGLEESALFKAARHGRAELCDALLVAGAELGGMNLLSKSVYDVILPRKRTQVLSVFERHGHREQGAPAV
jgi:ankyrin repeat protein